MSKPPKDENPSSSNTTAVSGPHEQAMLQALEALGKADAFVKAKYQADFYRKPIFQNTVLLPTCCNIFCDMTCGRWPCTP